MPTMPAPDEAVLKAVRDPDRGRRNLAALAAHLGPAAFTELCPALARLLPQAADPDMALNNLERLGRWLRANHLPRSSAHALIGKYVYLRYLKDRDILSVRRLEEWGIEPAAVFGRQATLKGLRSLVERLEEWLNGSVFPLDLTGRHAPAQEHLRRVAGAFHSLVVLSCACCSALCRSAEEAMGCGSVVGVPS